MQNSFGERLGKIRKSQGFTQEQLANIIGIAKSTLAHYERNNREPNILTIINLADALGVTIDELVGYETPFLPSKANSQDEVSLLQDYRNLTQQGKNYIQQTLRLALNEYKNVSYGVISEDNVVETTFSDAETVAREKANITYEQTLLEQNAKGKLPLSGSTKEA